MEKKQEKSPKVKAIKTAKAKDVKKTKATPVKAEKSDKKELANKSLRAKMTNLETAYMAAISGKMKFGKVKSIFKKLHKEIKNSSKK